MTSCPRIACLALPFVAMFVAGCPRDHLAADAGGPSRPTVAPGADAALSAAPPGSANAPAPARRSLAPRPGTVTSVLRPRLRVTPGVDAIELCRTRACESPQRVAVAPDGRASPTADLEPRTWFWRVAAGSAAPAGPLWSIVIRKAAGQSARVHGFDANGDGLADVPIEASLLFGSAGALADKLTRVPYAKLDAASAEAPAARRPTTLILPVGDVNGDGFDDAVLGDRILAGGPAGTRPEAEWLACPAGGCGQAAGDVDDDGYADLASEGALQLGSPGALRVVPSPVLVAAAAEQVRATPDLDGDGVADLAVLSKDHASLSVLHGGRAGLVAGPTAKVTLPTGDDASVDLELGDIDGDGTNDFVLLLSEPLGGALRTTVLVRSTPAGGDIARAVERRVAWTTPGQAGMAPSARLFIADLDGDGLDDVVVFLNGPHIGRARVIRGSKGALHLEPTSAGFLPKDDITGADFFSLGDVNGDGRDDVLFVGLPSVGFMQVFDLYAGGRSGLEGKPLAAYTMFGTQRVPTRQ